jgi:hypothetical protein
MSGDGPGLSTTRTPASGLARTLLALTLFGVAFGYVEAAVVVYLRALYEPVHQRLYPGRAAADLFPFVPLDRLEMTGPGQVNLAATELGREAATLLMLAAAALAVARNSRQWLAAFVLAFGLWDLFYYGFLAVLIGWPTSLLDWDLLFLLPVPWAAPVLAPVLVALTMVVAGVVVLRREAAGRPFRLTGPHWLGLAAAGLVLVVSFCWDYRATEVGEVPTAFNWPLFAAGQGLGLAVFLHGLRGDTSACEA